jgi:hypothetical protein
VESHGGYFCRLRAIDAPLLVRLARRALSLDSRVPLDDVALSVSFLPDRFLIRLAYDAPFTYGRRGARWYEENHGLARLASRELGTVVHAYVYDAEELEQVTTYGNGARVGGEKLDLREWEPDGEVPDDAAFEREKERWPLGRLARIYGITRHELVRVARHARSVLLDLDSPDGEDLDALDALWV